MTASAILVVTEGDLEVPVAARLFEYLGSALPPDAVINKRGGAKFWADAPKYNQAARQFQFIFALVDLEQAPCAPQLLARKMKTPRQLNFILRIAERMIESWLLADAQGLADFLGVPASRIPPQPDGIADAKALVVQLARQSRRRDIVSDLVPPPGLSGRVGRGYTSQMSEFARCHWDPGRARHHSPSLERALLALKNFI
jgi:hypothetical protein